MAMVSVMVLLAMVVIHYAVGKCIGDDNGLDGNHCVCGGGVHEHAGFSDATVPGRWQCERHGSTTMHDCTE
eukprot:5985313-Alexandrium_andersonii.AAC.1